MDEPNGAEHGVWTPHEAFFSSKSQTFGFGQTNWADRFWGIWGIFGRFISTNFGTVSPLSIFSKSTIISTKNLGLGFVFGPQRIRDSAIVCRYSVVLGTEDIAHPAMFVYPHFII